MSHTFHCRFEQIKCLVDFTQARFIFKLCSLSLLRICSPRNACAFLDVVWLVLSFRIHVFVYCILSCICFLCLLGNDQHAYFLSWTLDWFCWFSCQCISYPFLLLLNCEQWETAKIYNVGTFWAIWSPINRLKQLSNQRSLKCLLSLIGCNIVKQL